MDVALALLAVLGAFYFILLRPVIQQQRKQRQDISSLDVGDEVLTTAGFYATVVEINTHEDRPMEILLEVAPGVVLRGTTLAVQEISRRAEDDGSDDDLDEDDGDDFDEDELDTEPDDTDDHRRRRSSQ